MHFMPILQTILLYILAGLAEIGGGWLMWQWLREEKNIWWAIAGGAILVLYGIIPALQEEPAFGRVYAAYGGVFIVMALIWGRVVDGWYPDKYDVLGAAIALIGVAVIIWGRRF